MKISVIVPTRHRNDALSECLHGLAPGRQTLAPDEYEVIVCDDGVTGSAEALVKSEFAWARWFQGPRQGPAANRNRGASEAVGDWLVFTDDDCVPSPEWLEKFSEQMTGPARALEGAIHPDGDLEQDMAECPVNLNGGCFWSANIAIEAKLYRELGGFDANYRCREEDLDLKLRVAERTAISFVREASVTHPVRVITIGNSFSRVRGWARDRAYHIYKHGKMPGQRGRVAPFFFKWHIGQLFIQLSRGYPKRALDALFWITFGNALTLISLHRWRKT
jgi:GT2 family glycosyltransferase